MGLDENYKQRILTMLSDAKQEAVANQDYQTAVSIRDLVDQYIVNQGRGRTPSVSLDVNQTDAEPQRAWQAVVSVAVRNSADDARELALVLHEHGLLSVSEHVAFLVIQDHIQDHWKSSPERDESEQHA